MGTVQETLMVAVATGGLDRGFLKYSAAGENPRSPNKQLDGVCCNEEVQVER